MLAKEHMEEDPGIHQVFWARAANELRLLEVSGSIGDSGEVLPFRFTSDPPDVPYASIVILLGPRDWERVRKGDLKLPDTFGRVDELEKIAG